MNRGRRLRKEKKEKTDNRAEQSRIIQRLANANQVQSGNENLQLDHHSVALKALQFFWSSNGHVLASVLKWNIIKNFTNENILEDIAFRGK